MISIIVSVYNVEKYIIKCLESILKQEYTDFELILIDDGSADKSSEIINEYLKDKNISWNLIKKENGGQSSSRNLGLSYAKGEYIVFLDSDDVISKDFLSILEKLIKEKEADFSFCNFAFVKSQIPIEDNNNKIKVYNRNELLNTFLKREINFVLPSMMFRKDFIIDNNLLFNEDIRFSEDQMYIWNAIVHCKKAVYTNKKMYGYYLRSNSIMTGSPFNKIMNGFKVYKDFTNSLISEFSKDKNVLDLILPRWELGILYTAAKLVDYDEFLTMYKEMDGKNLKERLKGINEIKATALSIVAKCPKVLYLLCSKMK